MTTDENFESCAERQHRLMVRALAKPGADVRKDLTSSGAHLVHMSLGLAGEVGELIDALKKFAIYGKPLDQANVIDEMGDIEFYLAGVRDALQIDRQTILAANVAKLAKRYPTGSYTNSQAIDRADKQEGEGSSS